MSRTDALGLGRISAALLGAPSAALLVALVLGSVVPLSGELRLLLFTFVGWPAIALSPCLALIASNGARAWMGVAAVVAPCSALLVLT